MAIRWKRSTGAWPRWLRLKNKREKAEGDRRLRKRRLAASTVGHKRWLRENAQRGKKRKTGLRARG